MTQQSRANAARGGEVSRAAKTLSEAHILRSHPADTQKLIHELSETMDSLKQVTAQLSWVHSRAVNSSDYTADEGAGLAIEDAAAQLLAASRFLSAARNAVIAAERATSDVRWTKPRRSDPTAPSE